MSCLSLHGLHGVSRKNLAMNLSVWEASPGKQPVSANLCLVQPGPKRQTLFLKPLLTLFSKWNVIKFNLSIFPGAHGPWSLMYDPRFTGVHSSKNKCTFQKLTFPLEKSVYNPKGNPSVKKIMWKWIHSWRISFQIISKGFDICVVSWHSCGWWADLS